MTEEFEIERKKLIEDWARYTAERLQRSLLKKRVGQTGSLNYSILYHLKSLSGTEVSSVVHEFNYYGKFVDMGVGRGQKIEGVKTNGDLLRLLGGGRRPKKWFSKSYYAETIELSSLLAEKYGEDFQRIIKEEISLGPTTQA